MPTNMKSWSESGLCYRINYMAAFLLVPLSSFVAMSQVRTIGLMQNAIGSFGGYALFAPLSSTTTYLIDNSGFLVNSRESNFRSGNSFHLPENNHVLRTGTVVNSVFRAFRYSPDHQGLQERDLDPSGPIERYVTADTTYPVVDTGQEKCFDNRRLVQFPGAGEPFFGQDAQHAGNQPMYKDNGNGTVSDMVTGLMWQQNLFSGKRTYADARAGADTFRLAGYSDWRLPTIKELYSLIDYRGVTGMTPTQSAPYIDTAYFEFRYGGVTNPSERMIDAQYASSTEYKGTTMGGNPTMFGVNFADGRIKGYPQSKEFEVRYVRGNPLYGMNALVDNGNGTITDRATELMWERSGSSYGMNWEDALSSVYRKNQSNHLGYNDWRLPNAKELQSIVDYARSPTSTQSASISPLFNLPAITVEGGLTDYPFYWTSTTHEDGPLPDKAVYIAFGRAFGFMEIPPGSGNYQLQDVHGAGAQRSDPKNGDPSDYPHGHGPQGDVIRIFNYVLCVRDAGMTTGVEGIPESSHMTTGYSLSPNYPDPFYTGTTIEFRLPVRNTTRVEVRNILGQIVAILVDDQLEAGVYRFNWTSTSVPPGLYLLSIRSGSFFQTEKMILLEDASTKR